jgi:plasmid stability protein
MTEVRVRKVDPWIVESLRLRAKANGNSLEAELRELLREEALRPKRELRNELHRMRDTLSQKYGGFSDSATLIREDRDARG